MEEQPTPVEETILEVSHHGNGMFVIHGLSEKSAHIPLTISEAVSACNDSGLKFRFTSFPRSMRRRIQKKSGFMPRVGLVYEPLKKDNGKEIL